MKKFNAWRVVWVVSIYATLITILYLVVVYKVKWETRDFTKYLYFYDCGDNDVCTTDRKVPEYYSRVECKKDVCPRIIEINDDLVIIGDETDNYLYDYMSSRIINDSYKTYQFSSSDEDYIVKNSDGLYGVIDISGSVIVTPEFNNILDYDGYSIIYKENNKFKIGSFDEEKKLIILDKEYENASLFNKDKFVYSENDMYYLANTKTGDKVGEDVYDYLYPYKGVLFVFKDSKLDIVNADLGSLIPNKIDTFYLYLREGERASLRFRTIDSLIRFAIYDGNSEEDTFYIFDVKNNKLYN